MPKYPTIAAATTAKPAETPFLPAAPVFEGTTALELAVLVAEEVAFVTLVAVALAALAALRQEEPWLLAISAAAPATLSQASEHCGGVSVSHLVAFLLLSRKLSMLDCHASSIDDSAVGSTAVP